ncbi:MAG: hydrogenase maturation nickel metallochaperone HypA [Mobiluncus porci]|uniref:Hydrogenase maturation factor HypA n=1 Tax=Mobiluncus porci TaxID=2652278 RepID=A0A7K0K5H7_9ACTO|nr:MULTISPECIES: hydrogenase maturation nickel metallochaperone HypA [Mobiluncus]MCI6583442.1 hydrogenase maturation nickel metallochaperone HypA [Mobiluncus sp.]MDD7541038.1 hydrogenase maturation nickel metallochaperone HypA [Mobiluncus porci]MDY5749302.1 hydrogenase maturation nickel metallochaperone HypA [Mobiluncus porci]MST50708.1 hydrogenase maturation nickel metallochaperone HypA [Mobiluncus porci]
MHELALARSIFRIASRASGGRAVSRVYLEVGVLRQVVPEALEFAWGATARQAPNLAASRLVIKVIPAVIVCEDCGAETPIDENLVFACAACGSTRYRVKTGEEFTLTAMDVT